MDFPKVYPREFIVPEELPKSNTGKRPKRVLKKRLMEKINDDSSKRKTKKIFYGWWVVLACSLISFYVAGAIFFGFTAFFEPIAEEFGWSYTQISFAVTLNH